MKRNIRQRFAPGKNNGILPLHVDHRSQVMLAWEGIGENT
jgi:hypothetical protein